MKKQLTLICGFIVLCAAVVIVVLINQDKEVSDAEKDKAFKELLNDWQLIMSVNYKVTHYKESATRSEWGNTLIYSKLEIPKEQSVLWLAWLNDSKFVGKDPDAELCPVIPNPQLKKRMLWSIKSDLLPRAPKIDWWEAGSNPMYLWGFAQSDNGQHIDFHVIQATNGVCVLVEALSRKGEKKNWDRAFNK